MFTGIVENVGRVLLLEEGAGGLLLGVETTLPPESFRPGDSVAVDGVCLTVTGLDGNLLRFDLSHQTVADTTLQALHRGSEVHLERALPLGGRLGGHLVTGHVDAVGEVKRGLRRNANLDLVIQAPPVVVVFLVPKGAIAVDGVSLTVNQPQQDRFTVTLVPYTLERTTLGRRKAGDRVNLEADIIGKYVKHFVGSDVAVNSGVTEKLLREHGFLQEPE